MGRKNRSRRSKKDFEDSKLDVESGSCIQSGCLHVSKAVNLSNVKKVLKDLKNFSCQQCENAKINAEQKLGHTLLCLYCGNLGCDQESIENHSLLHFQTPHSDAHSVAFDLSNKQLWCYQCEESVVYEGNKKVLECIKFINDTRETFTRKRTLEVLSSLVNSEQLKNNGTAKSKLDQSSNVEKKLNIVKIKGLINLGNTCFLNSVLQSLVQTSVLYELISSRGVKGLTSTLGSVNYDDSKSDSQDELPPIDIILPEMGPLSHAFCVFVKDYANKNENINPNQLLGQICKRSPQFRGAMQQDSQELLRHLLDGLKSEEIKRYQAGILTSFKMDSKTDPKSVDGETKRLVKAYGRCLPYTAIDHIFSGQLISTVLCEECGMSSQVFEPFLDLSLPVAEDKGNRPGTGKKCVNDNDNWVSESRTDKPSKHQEKKSKKQAKRSAKLQRQKVKSKKTFSTEDDAKVIEHEDEPNEDSLHESKDSAEKEDFEMSDADVEDNAESGSTCSVNGIRNESAPAIVEGQELPNDEDILNFAFDDETKIDDKDLITKLDQLTLHEEIPAAEVNGICTLSEENHEEISTPNDVEIKRIDEIENEEPAAKQIGKTKWMSKSLTTLTSRYQPVPQECSIYSCLNQFTAPELLTGSNKFGCENCTRQKKEISRDINDMSAKKCSVVYTNASKQLLICSPPAILTLHLKRFQQAGYSLKKVNRHVDFPLILNLAPFCSSICLGLPTFQKSQHQVLYYLYAVVEHSGRLTGGHYTAFVRMCPKDENNRAFLNLKQVSQKDINKLIAEMQTKLCNCEDAFSCSENPNESSQIIEEDVNSKRWYHISDSSFREVTEEFVLGCQAYLLFYKRIL